jgi:hypothetical protein
MLIGRHYQNAYITRDIDRALDQFRQRTGRADLTSFEVSVPVTTPQGQGIATNKLAFIWEGGLQYELIQPVSGMVDVYADALPAGDALTFHHSATRISDWDPFRAKVDAEGWRIVLEGDTGGLKFLYLDARDFLGHYLEYVWMTDERWTQMGGGRGGA